MLVAVQLPAPLHGVVALLEGLGQVEAAAAGPDVGVGALVSAVLVVEVDDDVLEEIFLGGVLGGVDTGQGNGHGAVGLVGDGVVLGGPADAEAATGGRLGHLAGLAAALVLAAVSSSDRLAQGLIGTGLLAVDAIGAGGRTQGVLLVLLVVTVGIIRVELGEGLGLEGEAASKAEAGAVLVGPRRVLGVLEAPVDAVGVGVGFDTLGEEEDDGGGDEGQRGLGEGGEEHC